jgi:hypothetical protein
MPRPSSTPLVINDLRTISISLLKKKGLLNRDGPTEGDITYSNKFTKEITSSIGIEVCTQGINPYIRFDYSAGKYGDFSYSIPMVKVLSNLGKGFIWFFLDTETNKRCSKLFLLETHFVSRQAVLDAGGMYQCDLRQVNYRAIDNNRTSRLIKIVRQGFQKHFMSHYRGNVTKRQIRVTRAWGQLKQMGFENIPQVMEHMGYG